MQAPATVQLMAQPEEEQVQLDGLVPPFLQVRLIPVPGETIV